MGINIYSFTQLTVLTLIILTVSSFSVLGKVKHQPYKNHNSVENRMDNDQLDYLEFLTTGGMPPASYELFRLSTDGEINVLVGNAWPQSRAVNQAGIYQMKLEPKTLKSFWNQVEISLTDKGKKQFGKLRADSGYKLIAYHRAGEKEDEIVWNPIEDLPKNLEAIHQKILALKAQSKLSPRQIVQLEVKVDSNQKTGSEYDNSVQVQLSNPGTEAINISSDLSGDFEQLPILRYLTLPIEEAGEGIVPLGHIFAMGKKINWRELGSMRKLWSEGVFLPQEKQTFNIPFSDLGIIDASKAYTLWIVLEIPLMVSWIGADRILNGIVTASCNIKRLL